MRRLIVLLHVLLPLSLLAQEPFERLGQRSMMNGDFSSAANYFEKAYAADHANMNVLYLLGYSAYHANDYKKSIKAFDKLIAFKPDESVAYYYRGKAKMNLCSQIKDYNAVDKEPLLLSAIKDFTTGIALSPADMKFYQNRGLAYQEYSVYKSQKVNGIYNKNAVISAATSSIADLKKVLGDNSGRRDILNQIERSKQIITDISR